MGDKIKTNPTSGVGGIHETDIIIEEKISPICS
jgi:hypothetical protein